MNLAQAMNLKAKKSIVKVNKYKRKEAPLEGTEKLNSIKTTKTTIRATKIRLAGVKAAKLATSLTR